MTTMESVCLVVLSVDGVELCREYRLNETWDARCDTIARVTDGLSQLNLPWELTCHDYHGNAVESPRAELCHTEHGRPYLAFYH